MVLTLIVAVATFFASLAYPAVGPVLVLRWYFEGKPYFGKYLGFHIGTGVCYAILMAVASTAVDFHRFYVEPWFVLPLFALVYPGVVWLSRVFAKKAAEQNRPEEADVQWGERYYTYHGLPLAMCGALLALIIAVVEHPLVALVDIPTLAVWGIVFFVIDAKVPVPQSIQEWRGFAVSAIIMMGSALARIPFGL